jgi:hypothetical protein
MVEPSGPDLGIVAVATWVAAWAFGPEAAGIIGPYSVIILCAIGGASWSASRVTQTTRHAVVMHIALRAGMSMVLTVSCAKLMGAWMGVEPSLLFGAVAIVLAARPDWVIVWLLRLWDLRPNNPKGPQS